MKPDRKFWTFWQNSVTLGTKFLEAALFESSSIPLGGLSPCLSPRAGTWAVLENPNPSTINATRADLFGSGRESVPAMQLDPAKYSHHLTGLNLSHDDSLRLMEQLWAIMESFVDRAFGQSPEQILLGIDWEDAAVPAADPIDSKDILSPIYNNAAQQVAAGKTTP